MRLLSAAFAALAALYLFSAAVQWNDPDPLPWAATYLAAAALSAATAAGRPPPRALPALLAAGALAAAGWIAAHAAGDLGVPAHFATWQMKGGAAEQAREIGGLALVALGMAGVAAVRRG